MEVINGLTEAGSSTRAVASRDTIIGFSLPRKLNIGNCQHQTGIMNTLDPFNYIPPFSLMKVAYRIITLGTWISEIPLYKSTLT